MQLIYDAWLVIIILRLNMYIGYESDILYPF